MTEKYKGLIITFDKEISEEFITEWQNIFMKIKNVCAVKPLVKNFEDYMSEEKGRIDFRNEVLDFLRKDILKRFEPKD